MHNLLREFTSTPLQRESDLHRHLKMLDSAILNMTTGLDNLKPSNVAEALSGAGDAGLDGILYAGFGRANDFDDFVDVLVHLILRWVSL